MARFTRSLAQTFLRPRSRQESTVVSMLPAAEVVLDDPAERLGGPGWFDSSWDLQRGLEVREGLPGDPQLNEWIEVCLRGGAAAAKPAPIVAATMELPVWVPPAVELLAQPVSRQAAAADRPCDWALV
jgi:hypothetical protein